MLKRRKSLRLKSYDYSSSGAYFITVCSYKKGLLFGEVSNDQAITNSFGLTVKKCWDDLPNHYPQINLDSFIVMPNHVHGIVWLMHEAVGAGLRPAPTPLSEIVRAFKSFSGRRINELRKTPSLPVWQRNYYEHVIHDEEDLNKIREYITNNPLKWALDEENPANKQGHVGAGLRPAPIE